MELVLKHPEDPPLEPANDLLAMVVCEDAAAAWPVRALLRRVGRNAGEEGRLIYSGWSFTALASPSLGESASREAEAADMIIISARQAGCLPAPVKNWLSRWLVTEQSQQCHRRPKALVALLGPAPKLEAPSQGVLSELKELAESAEVDFFAKEDAAWSDVNLSGDPCPRSAAARAGTTGTLGGSGSRTEGGRGEMGMRY